MPYPPSPKRRRGGQPGNTNALKTGVYSRQVGERLLPLTPASSREEILTAAGFVQARVAALLEAASRSYGRQRQALVSRADALTLRFLLQVARATGDAAVLERIPPNLLERLPERNLLLQLTRQAETDMDENCQDQ